MLVVAVSCERSDDTDVDCPPEATVERWMTGSGEEAVTHETCKWGARYQMIDTDARGNVVGRLSTVDRVPDGLQISRDFLDRRVESNYRRGVLHGPMRHFEGGQLVYECSYVDGLRDGFCYSKPMGEGFEVKQYDRGKRTGVWWSELGNNTQTWVYGADILLSIDGRTVPLPPASIEVDGELVVRTACEPAGSSVFACAWLFDAYQLCEQDVTDPVRCRAKARGNYKATIDRQRRKAALFPGP